MNQPEMYKQRQVGWVIIIAIGFMTALTLFLIPRMGFGLTVWILIAALTLMAVLFGVMTVTVDSGMVRIIFGVGLIRRTVPLSEIEFVRMARYHWIYGWGIRLVPLGWMYRVAGLSVVELHLKNGRVCAVGSSNPKELLAQIQARADLSGKAIDPDVLAARQKKGLRIIFVFVFGVTVLVVLFVGGVLWYGGQKPQVTVSRETVSFSGMYGTSIPLWHIKSAALTDVLPRFEVRTNGYALGGTVKGHFRVSGPARAYCLLMDIRTPPYLVLQVQERIYLINFKDPAETKALFNNIQEQLKLSK